jgi:hypothetical protein
LLLEPFSHGFSFEFEFKIIGIIQSEIDFEEEAINLGRCRGTIKFKGNNGAFGFFDNIFRHGHGS